LKPFSLFRGFSLEALYRNLQIVCFIFLLIKQNWTKSWSFLPYLATSNYLFSRILLMILQFWSHFGTEYCKWPASNHSVCFINHWFWRIYLTVCNGHLFWDLFFTN
jgi:hypothetical protein